MLDTKSSQMKLLLPLLSCAMATACAADRRPNVLVILTDDQGWGDVAIHGNSNINTPAIDQLYRESAVIDRFMASPLSAPTRASLLTGRYHLRTGVSSVQSGLENMNPEETTLAELFKESGYATGCFGKWHNGAYYPYTPNGQGFDEFLGFCCGHWANYFDPELQHNEQMTRGKGYITDILTDAAIKFITDNRDRPFFCYVPYNAPHSPLQVPDRYYDHYRDLPVEDENDKAEMAAIYGMVECVDHNMSRLLSALDSLGIRENTIVVYMSDNGPVHVERYNGDMRGGKGSVHEGGVRVPCYINWENHIAPKVIDGPYAHVDILPTLMDLCGIEGYETRFPIDGISMKDALMGDADAPAGRMIFTHRLNGHLSPALGGVRTARYRLEVYPEEKVSLYDMQRDPSENNDILDSGNPEHKELYSRYLEWFDDASTGVREADRSVPVGYEAAPQVRIPAPEGRMSGMLKCYGYPNQNWVNHFVAEDDSLSFTLDVIAEGDYDVSVDYSNAEDTGAAAFFVRTEDGIISVPVPQFITEFRYSPDRVVRDEAPDMTWSRLRIGKIHLNEGRTSFSLYAAGIKDRSSVRVKTLILDRL